MISLALDTPELAAHYDVAGRRQLEHGKLLVSDLDVRPGHRILDVGCGTGLLGAHVARLVGPAGKVVGIDPLPLRIELARRRASASFEPAVGRAEDLSVFAPASFDVVLLNSVVHWLPDPLGVLRQIRRVLKTGGRVGFTTAAKERPHTIAVAVERAIQACGLDDRAGLASAPQRWSCEDVSALFRTASLRETQVLIRSFVDHFPDLDAVLAFSRASSFGNHLASLSEAEQGRVRDALAAELEQRRTPRGIELQRNLVFAVAEKERTSCACGAGAFSGSGGGLT